MSLPATIAKAARAAKRRARISPFAFDPLRPVPSITQQTPHPCAFYQFPYRHKVQYFNPSIIDWMGNRHLVTRRRRFHSNPGKNDITLWQLEPSTHRPLLERPILFPIAHPFEHWEDPRAIVHNGAFWLGYATFRSPWSAHFVHQGLGAINYRCQAIETRHVSYGHNRPHPLQNTGHEKNWLWFFYGNELLFIYATSPQHIVVKASPSNPTTEWRTPSFKWRFGLPRGGTPPILHDGLYWSFFHSSLEISPTPPRRRYYMGAYAFEAKPPFAPVLYTRRVLLTGSEADPREPSAPMCVFPCGTLLDANVWHVTLGVNDCACAWWRIPHNDLRKQMSSL